ncbi:MAG: spore coat protein U domain-containing protein [Vulcanimicrobiaceae bacterium]
MRTALAALALAGAIALPQPALAAVTCAFNGDPFTLSFGNYDPVSGNPTTATLTIAFTCNGLNAGGTTVAVKANKGANGTLANRKMIGAVNADLLPYMASLNASESPIFGNGNSGTQLFSTTLFTANDGQLISFTVYGNIAAAISGGSGDVHADTYSDAVKLTLTY